ncbi:MAG: DUF2158 domain-containing protein [Beijerinckiaceae bacterium]
MPRNSKNVFEIGATVALRSGGPGLTVLGQAGDRVHCVFFSDELGEFRETMLPVAALILADFEEEEDDEEDHDGQDNEGHHNEDEAKTP